MEHMLAPMMEYMTDLCSVPVSVMMMDALRVSSLVIVTVYMWANMMEKMMVAPMVPKTGYYLDVVKEVPKVDHLLGAMVSKKVDLMV